MARNPLDGVDHEIIDDVYPAREPRKPARRARATPAPKAPAGGGGEVPGPDWVQVATPIPPQLHRRLKIAAIDHATPARILVLRAIAAYLDDLENSAK